MTNPNDALKKRQTIMIGGSVAIILVLVLVGMFFFDSPPSTATPKQKLAAITPPGTIDDKDAWRATESTRNQQLQQDVARLASEKAEAQRKLDELAKKVDALAAAASAPAARQGLDAPVPRGSAANASLGQQVLSPPTGPGTPVRQLNQPIGAPPADSASAPPRQRVEVIRFGPKVALPASGVVGSAAQQTPEVLGFPVDEKAKKYGAAGGRTTPIEFIPAGSFVRATLLNGVDAPTGGQAQSNPLPMALHVMDVASLANKHKLNIKDCRFVAAAWGDISSERTMARTDSLTCIINGETIEMVVKGSVIGEDGKAGIRGRLVEKQGQMLANALFAGSLSGIGKAFQSAATTTTTNGGGITQTIQGGDLAEAAIGGGVSTAANMLAQYYLKAADKLYPIIETDGGRIVEILITKGATYNGNNTTKSNYQNILQSSSGKPTSASRRSSPSQDD